MTLAHTKLALHSISNTSLKLGKARRRARHSLSLMISEALWVNISYWNLRILIQLVKGIIAELRSLIKIKHHQNRARLWKLITFMMKRVGLDTMARSTFGH